MQWSAILRFIKDEKNDFNHRVENMTSLTKNIELQGAFRNNLRLSGERHCSDMPERSLINECCEHCSKSPDYFPAGVPHGKFQCAKMG